MVTLAALFWCFCAIGGQSFGGGMSAWVRRAVVDRRHWLGERSFLTGLALSQISPGPNAVNLAVYVGTTLRGAAGAIVAVGGTLGVPVLTIAALGALYFGGHAPESVDTALAGTGAAAIGLMFANGIRLSARGIRDAPAAVVMVATALAVGYFRAPLLIVLGLAVPASIALAARSMERRA
jgi:chromate transporter